MPEGFEWLGYVAAVVAGGVIGLITAAFSCGTAKLELLDEISELRARNEELEAELAAQEKPTSSGMTGYGFAA